MLCRCHHEPMVRRWHTDRRRPSGGYWNHVCLRHERERQMAKYDNDPVWRITKNLKNDARKRAQTIRDRKAQHGSLPR